MSFGPLREQLQRQHHWVNEYRDGPYIVLAVLVVSIEGRQDSLVTVSGLRDHRRCIPFADCLTQPCLVRLAHSASRPGSNLAILTSNAEAHKFNTA